jgi:uncharacterized membrane protein
MVGDYFLLVIRWLHATAAVAWLGGGIFYWAVLRPALRSGEAPSGVARLASVEFSQLVGLAMWVLVVTGGVLGVQRLSEETSTVTYFSVLAVKVALSAWMFFLVVTPRGTATKQEAPHGRVRLAVNALGHVNMTVVLGLMIFFLSDVLRFIVERGLAV